MEQNLLVFLVKKTMNQKNGDYNGKRKGNQRENLSDNLPTDQKTQADGKKKAIDPQRTPDQGCADGCQNIKHLGKWMKPGQAGIFIHVKTDTFHMILPFLL